MLPIFDLYCSDAIKPTYNILSVYAIPDDAHKEMPICNIVLLFHQNLTLLWNKTILSNYEFDTVTEWLDFWLNVRKTICSLADKCCDCIFKVLSAKTLNSLAVELDVLRKELTLSLCKENRYPKEDRPFEDKAKIPEGLIEIKSNYFQSMQNFSNQFAGFIKKENKNQRLVLVNLTMAQNTLAEMQHFFSEIAIEFGLGEKIQSYVLQKNKV